MISSRRLLMLIIVLAVASTSLGATDEATLKQRVAERSKAVVEMLQSGLVSEGTDGFLKPAYQLDAEDARLMGEENKDREEIFALIAKKSKLSVDEVAQMYAKRARAKWPPQVISGYGTCHLVPAKNTDLLRLLEYMKQGMNYASSKRFESALAEFQSALAIDKNFLGLQQNIGSSQFALKRYQDAETSLKAELRLAECLGGLSDDQLAEFSYFMEVPNKSPGPRSVAQAHKLRSELPKVKASVEYNLACVYSAERRKDEAIQAIRAAVDEGFTDKKALSSDSDLAFIRQTPEFRALLASLR